MPPNEGARKQRVNNAIQQFHVTGISHTAATTTPTRFAYLGWDSPLTPSNTDKGVLCYYALLYIIDRAEPKLGLIRSHMETR
jgi:hypothetical protein